MVELRGREERAALLAAFEEDLPRLLPDVRVIDRGLDLSRGPVRGTAARRADLVMLDASGRPIVVLVVDGRGDDTLLAAVNAVAFARQSGDALARPEREEPPSPGSARVALVAESYSARTLEGLALLPEDELLVFEARHVDTAAGSHVRLARLRPAPRPREEARPDRAGFLARVDDPWRPTADLLLRRLARVDAGLAVAFETGAASLRNDLGELCALEVDEGRLAGSIPALKRRIPIHGLDDADAFLDEVVREHILQLGEGWALSGGSPGLPDGGSGGGSGGEEPLLTPEEIAAFRE